MCEIVHYSYHFIRVSGVRHAKRIWGETQEEVGIVDEQSLAPMTTLGGRSGSEPDRAREQPGIEH